MKLIGVISTAVLSLTLGVGSGIRTAGAARPAGRTERKACPGKREESATREAAKPEEKNASGRKERQAGREERAARAATQPEAKPEKQEQHAGNGGRIPDDRYKANFGREHRFRVSEGDYRNHRFQYGGYWFGFVDPWPSNWLYTQDVYVIEIDGVYYLCNPMYPGVNVALNVTLVESVCGLGRNQA